MIEREELTGNSTIDKLVEFLKENVDDKFPRDYKDDYEQGKYAGRLIMLDFIESLCTK